MVEHILRDIDGTPYFQLTFQPVTLYQMSGKRWLSVPEANDIIRAAMLTNNVNIGRRRCVIRTIRCKTNH